MQDKLVQHNLVFNGRQAGFKHIPAFDLYTDLSVSSTGYGGTFAVPADSSLDVILAKRAEQAQAFQGNRK